MLGQILDEKRWLDADRQNLVDDINATKIQLEQARKRTVLIEKKSEKAIKKLNDQLDIIKKEFADLHQVHDEDLMKLNELNSKISSQGKNNETTKLQELEKRLRTMADEVMNKTSIISTLKLQLNTVKTHVASLKKEKRMIREQCAFDSFDEESKQGALRLRITSRDDRTVPLRKEIKSKTVLNAVGCLDSFGTSLSLLLRRRPIIRLIFAFYILLIHLWVAYVMYHFHTDHAFADQQLTPIASLNIMNQRQ